MVNVITAFKDTFGRDPTPSEARTMMKMQAEQDLRRREQIKNKHYETRVKETKYKTKRPKPRYPTKMGQRAHHINRMLLCQIRIKDIAYILDLSESFVKSEMDKWKLPRQPID